MTGSAFSIPPSVSSENTTPKPKVSSGALRSQTVISASGRSCLASAAKYRPPGPPPATAMRTVPPRVSLGVVSPQSTVCRIHDDRQQNATEHPSGDPADPPVTQAAETQRGRQVDPGLQPLERPVPADWLVADLYLDAVARQARHEGVRQRC